MGSIVRKMVVPVALAVALAMVGGACGGDGGGGSGSGSVRVSGSSTVEPISALIAEKFASQNGSASISVEGPGTTDGFILFCEGSTDINDASRPIAPEEEGACAGIDYVELYIAIDGLSVVVPTGSPVECLTFNDLYAIFGPESSDVSTWGDAAALSESIGGESGIPDELADTELVITRPGEESGTYGSFVEIVTSGIAEEQGVSEAEIETLAVTSNTQQSGNDNVIIDGVAGSEGGIGFVGFAFAHLNRDRVKLVEVDGGDGCVAPDADTISAGDYAIARPLYIYPNVGRAAESTAVSDFVDYYLSDAGYEAVAEADYIQVPPADWEATNRAWRDARAGRRGD